MISPLGQRQIFQTANVEAVRQAHEVGEQIQRENTRKQAADAHLQEDQTSVRVVADSERIRTDERQGRQEQGEGGQPGEKEETPEAEPEGKPAESAEARVDFLA